MFTKHKRKEMVRTAAMAAAVGFLGIAAFEGALALGAPLGRAAMAPWCSNDRDEDIGETT